MILEAYKKMLITENLQLQRVTTLRMIPVIIKHLKSYLETFITTICKQMRQKKTPKLILCSAQCFEYVFSKRPTRYLGKK